MRNLKKRWISILLCIAMLLPFVAFELPAPVAATNHGEYDTVAMVYDYGTCPSMQGLGLCGDYLYAVKTDGDDYAATVTRIHKETGAKNMLTNSGNGSYYFYDFGHGNDCEVVVAGGKTNMFIPTSATGTGSLVRYTLSGTTATKYGSYQMVSPSGANIGGGAIRAARVDDENIYLLFKSGMTLYTGTLPITQTSGKLVMTQMCTLDTSGVYVNGSYVDLSAFIGQGMGYHDHRVYIPISGHSQTATINQSIILVYDIQGASGTIKPLNDPTFRVTSSAYSALYEIESCVIDPETDLLYFNTNRRKTSSDTNYDGVHWITNWVYEPQNRTTAVENYRWEPIDGKLSSVTTGGSVFNGLAWHHGSLSGNTITDGRYTTDRNIVLKHDRPWVVEWKSGGCTAGQLLMATQAVSYFANAPYIFVNDNNSRVSIGAYSGSQYNNYACDLATYGVDPSTAEVFRLTNKIASDGSNMVWLSVDGKELGPLNQYYVASTSQGTTSNWISGKDFSFSYLGTNNHPINDSLEYIQVWGDGMRSAVDEPDTFRWETSGNALNYVSGFDHTNNALTLDAGSISGTTYTAVEYDPAFDIKLLHDRPWSIEWAGSYTSGGMILAADHHGNTEHAPYLFRSGILAFGERDSGAHHNYGIKLSDKGISYSERHVYRLTNRIAADGSNMVYLYVDGVEIGAMNNYFKGTSAQNTTVNWLNGRDLTFSHLGAYGYSVSGDMEYLQIWEGGIVSDATVHDYRWEAKNGKLESVQSGTFVKNEATLHAGTISGSTFTTPGYAQLDQQLILRHDEPWAVEWKSQGSYAGNNNGTMLLASSNIGNLEGSAYLFCTSNHGYVTLGVRQNSANHNYGIDLTDHGIDLTAAHTFTLTNEPASNGSNMIYLSVDGVEIGAMNNYYKGITAQGTTSDFLSGKDLVFSFLGTKTYPISCTLEYLQVFSSCSHTYGGWVVDKAATCTQTGSRHHTCTGCGYTETETIAATGHSYDKTSYPGSCVEQQRDEYTCSKCGDFYIVYPESSMSDWVETLPEGIDMSLVETKTQYRYSDYETTTSYETSLPGYTQIGSAWVKSGSGTVNYVNSWSTGFYTSCSLYEQYNKKSSKVTASETATTKTVIDSDAAVGYLYHHWCYSGSYYSVQSSSGSYTTFHAFYSTIAPSSLSNYDASDGSYYFPNSSSCSNSEWWWPTTVNAQKYTTYNKQFTYERWTDWSDWSDTPVEATGTRKVETRTVYRYVDTQLTGHKYVNGSCTLCGATCQHDWSGSKCTICGLGCAHPSHDTSGSCTSCGTTVSHSYTDITLDPTCTTGGYITHKCTVCGSSYNSDFTAPLGHSYVDGVCSDCGRECSHSEWSDGSCTTCGMACRHSWSSNSCSLCGMSYPVKDYYLFGYINGSDYACEGDYQNLGEYKFVNGKLTAFFATDSYVAVKSGDNADWYMTAAYYGESVTAATLFNTSTGAAEKLFVPGGKDIVFTLKHNGDDTFTLSYVATDCPHTSHDTNGECTRCGAAVGHSYGSWTTVTNATCTKNGQQKRTCACGATETKTINATGHSYSSKVTAPTCTAEGYTTHTCSVCGDSYTDSKVAATGHSYGAWVTVTNATCTKNGQQKRTCACGATETKTINATGHSYSGGSCTSCGAADPDAVKQPTLTLKYPSLSFEGEVLYNIYFTGADMDSVVEMGMITFNERLTDGTIADAVDVIPGYSGSDGVYMVQSLGIPAKALGDTVFMKVYAKLSDGSYVYSDVAGYNAAAYAKSVLNGSSSDEMKALVVSMLNYGTEAQLYFKHNTDNLMNSFLSAEQQAMIPAYDESLVDPIVAADSTKAANFPRTTSVFSTLYASVSFDGAFSINYYVMPSVPVDDGITFYYWDAETYATADKLTAENAVGSMTMTYTDAETPYWGCVPNIAAKYMDTTYYAAGVFESNGTTYTTGVISYSLGRYCESVAAKDGNAQQAFAKATAVYGWCAEEYFASI